MKTLTDHYLQILTKCNWRTSLTSKVEIPTTTPNSRQPQTIVTINSIIDDSEASWLETPLDRPPGRSCHQTLTRCRSRSPATSNWKSLRQQSTATSHIVLTQKTPQKPQINSVYKKHQKSLLKT